MLGKHEQNLPLAISKNSSNTSWAYFTSCRTINIELQGSKGRRPPRNYVLPLWQTTHHASFPILGNVIKLTLEYSFLHKNHLDKWRATEGTISSIVEGEHLKILSFLSFQTDQRITKGIRLHINKPHPNKGPNCQAPTMPTRELGRHHEIPHTLRKWFQVTLPHQHD